MKILCLIIDSDGPWIETYAVHRRLWNEVLDRSPYVDGYFLRSDPNLGSEHAVAGRVFTVRGEERYDTILEKSLKAIEALLGDHDYVLRTNLSSMYDFLLLQNTPLARENLYAGSLYEQFVSGSGMILSRDVAAKLIKPLHPTVRTALSPCDDVAIWQILSWNAIRPTVLERYDYDYARDDEQLSIGRYLQYRLRDLGDPDRVTERYVAERLFSRLYADDRIAALQAKRLALVTCLYDLVKRGVTTHRTPTGLLDESTFVLHQDRELIVFTEPELKEEVLRRREGRPTVVVTTPFEELLGGERTRGAERGAFQTNALIPRKNQPYVQLTWAKFAMVEKARTLTTASHIGWIDIGITHVAKLPPPDVDIFANPPDAPRIHILRCFSKHDVDKPDYWHVVWGHAAAGLIVGHRDQMQRLVVDFWSAVDRAIAMGLVPFEEALVSYIVAQRPDMFTYSYGDYEDILRNHDAPRGGEKHIAWIVADARSRGLPETMGARPRAQNYVHDPINSTMEICGFPSVLLDRRLDEKVHLPGRDKRDLIEWSFQLAAAGKQFVDCGAYTGSWTLLMATHFQEVHAFEPQRLAFQRLCGNVALNGLRNVYAHHTALDEHGGAIVLHCPPNSSLLATTRVDLLPRLQADQAVPLTEDVPARPLDDFEATLTDVGLMKVNVTGMELRVLKGALTVLRRNELPKLLCECWSADWYRDDKQELLEFLHGIGYRIVPISGYPNVLLAEKR